MWSTGSYIIASPTPPGAVPQTSAAALNNATLPYGLALAEKGVGALHALPDTGRGLLAGLNVHKGKANQQGRRGQP